MEKNIEPRPFWHRHNATIVLIGLLIIFMAYSIFLALKLQKGIIPDEPAHFAFSEYFSTTWGIPKDSPTTYIYGWYINQNPFLYFWLNGRALNILHLIVPSASEWQMLIFLRILNAVYSLGTVIFCYLLSKEIIRHKWWQLLPVFLLTNTLMFVFLSGGVNYDNLANLFSAAGLYFLVRVFYGKDFVSNSLGWIICICLGTLVKYPILPLALAMGIAWLIFTIKYRKLLFPIKIYGAKMIAMSLISVGVIAGNLGIYGVNLVKYHAITPACTDFLSTSVCELSPFVERYNQISLDHKLTITESIQLGYPNPIEYVVDSWIPNMFYRIFGILAHLSYFPSHIIILYRLLLFWGILLAFRYWKKPAFGIYSLIGIFVFYALVLLYMNYDSELIYGFKQIAMQGRYIFPVIGAAYVLIGYFLMNVQNRALRVLTLVSTLALFFAGGPIKFILHYNTIFQGWFV